MTARKSCDTCKAAASDVSRTECEYCGGTSFTYQGVSEQERYDSISGPDPQRYATKPIVLEDEDPYNSNIVDGLLDTSFRRYSTIGLASFTYTVSLYLVGLIFALCAVVLILIFIAPIGFLQKLGFILAIAVGVAGTLVWLAALRLRLESFTALVQVARNTSKAKKSGA